MHVLLLVYLSACHRHDDDTTATTPDEHLDPHDSDTGGETGGTDSPPVGDDTGPSGDSVDTAKPEDTATGPRGWTTVDLADLAPLSDDDCPDLSVSGTTSFLSDGVERTVTVLIPTRRSRKASLVFFFHGLTTPAYGDSPGAYIASALDLQTVADDLGAVILLPDAPLRSLMGYEFFLWDVEDITGADLVLYDDLRTCAANDADLGIDLSRVYAYGFSGGALFTTEVIRHRADTLAAAVEMSGGADVSIPLYSYEVAPYDTPSWTLPVLVISGGEDDVWPDPSMPLIDFDGASDTLADLLSYDGSLVLRCRHSSGHAVTLDAYDLSEAWIDAHEFGVSSPYATGELSEDDAEWCTRIDPDIQ